MCYRYKSFSSDDYSSKVIRELTYNLVKSNNGYDDEILEKCLEYNIKNHKYLLAENVEKILTLFFLEGYRNEKLIEFLPYAAEIIEK